MNLKRREGIYKKAISTWGETAQYEMAQEESTELALAVRKHIRKNDDHSYSNLVEEIADVEIMIEQIKMMNRQYGIEKEIEFQKLEKLHRLNDRLDKKQFN